MITCASCGASLADDSRFCPSCGTRVDQNQLLTRASDPSEDAARTSGPRPPSSGSGWLSGSGDVDHGRFAPGAMLTARYRIVGRLGRGGMGEVYRADDLALGQPVALKFLPPALEREPARLAQLFGEVRMARQVSHPNVCRVYDIGEVGGTHFISMEYVDGEDLGSLIRRIGRLPEDKAAEIARQICAGLAAAHDRGVLHRDLKPANVMIDGRGSVRLTDFGLAGVAGEVTDVRVGTPAYMAPEQLSGLEVTAQSDVYALGLVLYELFTGRRVFDAANLADLLRLHEQDAIALPSAIVSTLDPSVDRAVMRCLARDPKQRPASALAVAAALPGGDPLAAALAAGETPSPEMVAAAGDTAAMPAARGLVWLAAVAAGLVAVAALYDHVILFARIPAAKPTAVLLDRAGQIRSRLGFDDVPADEAFGAAIDNDTLRWMARAGGAADGFATLDRGRPPALVYWYRSSPRKLVPLGSSGVVDLDNPPSTVSGMLTLMLDGQGRLLEFHAVPPQTGEGAPAPVAPPDWRPLFEAADLPMERFAPAEPQWTPRGYADHRAAWEGEVPDRPGARVRVETASYLGRVVFFEMIGPWSRPSRMQPFRPDRATAIVNATASILVTLLLAGAALLARHNARAGRGDRRGALRVSAFVFAVDVVGWTFGAHHVADLTTEVQSLMNACGGALLDAGFLWLLYLAVEPTVRRAWPHMLISWTRLLAGSWRDPRVGRDILIGVAAAVAATLIAAVFPLATTALGLPAPLPHPSSPMLTVGARYWVAELARLTQTAMRLGMLGVFALVLLRRLVRQTWIAATVAAVAFGPLAAQGLFESGALWLDLGFGIVLASVLFFVMQRFGLVAAIASFVPHLALLAAPVTLRLSAWYSGPAVAAVLLVAGLAVYGYYAARAGQPLLGQVDREPVSA